MGQQHVLMSRRRKRQLSPQTVVPLGTQAKPVRITTLSYTGEQFEEREITNIEECFALRNEGTITWITVKGVHDVEVIEQIGKCFELHPLLIEDIIHAEQRPKADYFEKSIFLVVKILSLDKNEQVNSEQISIVLGHNFIVSFEEFEDDTFKQVRERIKKGRFAKRDADYVMYSLIDAIVDNYFLILERLGERIETLEEQVVQQPTLETIQAIYNLKTQMIFLRKNVWPLREVISSLLRTESKLVKKSTHFYLRDVYDHTVQVIETVETQRDMIAGMLEIYLSSMSNRMNEIMKVLTIMGTIFIPLTFITSLYGMNFEFMPELKARYGYFVILAVMALVAVFMLFYFRKKKWI